MENNSRPTQCDRILRHLTVIGGITQMEAIQDYGIMRLPSRVSEMRKKGIPIVYMWEYGRNRFVEACKWKRYYLEEEKGE